MTEELRAAIERIDVLNTRLVEQLRVSVKWYRMTVGARTRFGRRFFHYEGRFQDWICAERAAERAMRDAWPSATWIVVRRLKL